MGDTQERKPVERIIPSELGGEDLWNHNGEYVAAFHYDALVSEISRLRSELEKAAKVQEPRDRIVCALHEQGSIAEGTDLDAMADDIIHSLVSDGPILIAGGNADG